MRIILILLAFICFTLNAQDENKTALTAGGEFLNNNETPQSITASQTMIVSEPAYRNEVPALSSVKSEYNTTKPGILNPLVYILVFILFAIALYFIKAKNRAQLNTTVTLEDEEVRHRKKQLWDALGETKEGE